MPSPLSRDACLRIKNIAQEATAASSATTAMWQPQQDDILTRRRLTAEVASNSTNLRRDVAARFLLISQRMRTRR